MVKGLVVLLVAVLTLPLAPGPDAGGAENPARPTADRTGLRPPPDPQPRLHPSRLVIRTDRNVRSVLDGVTRRFGIRERRSISSLGAHAVDVPPGTDVAEVADAYRALEGVTEVRRAVLYQVLRTPNDPGLSSSNHHELIATPNAWDLTTGNPNGRIAIVDTGVFAGHEDLAGRVAGGRNFVDDRPASNWSDGAGHGTIVAGIAAAAGNNGKGGAGVTWQDKILAARVMDDDGVGDDFTIADGIRWSADQGARIINLSLGGPGYSGVLADAVSYARARGSLVVAGAGNDATSTPWYPAALPGVVSVGATNSTDHIPLWTSPSAPPAAPNYGSTIDLVAPGTSILGPGILSAGDYELATGTSMAAPIVAGVAALVWDQFPGMSADQVAARMRSTADDLGLTGPDRFFGSGRVNASRAAGGSASRPPAQEEPSGEPGNTLEQAESPAANQQATLYPSGDVDWWRVDVPAGGHLEVQVEPPSTIDPVVEIYSPSLELIEIADVPEVGAAEGALLNLTEGGTYWIGVRNWLPNAATSAYTIDVVAGSGSGGVSFRPPEPIRRTFFPWYDFRGSGGRNWLMTSLAGTGGGVYVVTLAGDDMHGAILNDLASESIRFGDLVSGPVEIRSFADDPVISSQRVLWTPDNFEEVSAIPSQDLTTHAWFSFYDGRNTNGMDWVLAANPGPWSANVRILFEGTQVATRSLGPGENLVWRDINRTGGPVQVLSDRPIFTTRRTLWRTTNFSETPGIPDASLRSQYLFPFYDSVVTGGSNWILVANPNPDTIQVRITVEGKDGGSPAADDTVSVPPGQSVAKRFADVSSGPVRVRSVGGERFITTQRNLFDEGRSFEEIAGIPPSAHADQWRFTWYDAKNTGNQDWVLVTNPGTSAVNVTIRIGTVTVFGPQQLEAGRTVAPRFSGRIGGPIRVDASGPVVSTRRTLWGSDFTELLGVQP